MLKDFKRFISLHELCTQDDNLLVAVSGGIDSVVLLHLLIASKYRVAIAHCNFGLRGEESDEDEVFVRQLSEKYKLKFFIKNCDARQFAIKNKVSIQESARTLRYQFFETLREKVDINKVVIGHNLDDNLESFFINLSRASGLKGLIGMPVHRGLFIRPLLFASREQILKYAKTHGLSWREDSSNASDKYLRNRIRHHLIPQLKSLSNNFLPVMLESMDHLKEADTLFDQLLEEKRSELMYEKNGHFTLDIKKLMDNKNAELLLFYLLKNFKFDRKVISQLYKAIMIGVPGKQFLSNKYNLFLNRNQLLIRQKTTPSSENVITFSDSTTIPVHLGFSIVIKRKNFRFTSSKNNAFFDAGKIPLPLSVRHWHKGDRFKPFGMNGSKLVSDLLIDEKLSPFNKKKVNLLLSGNIIVWVIGYRSSENFKVTDQTKEILKIKYFPK